MREESPCVHAGECQQRIDRVENELDTVKEILMTVARRYEEGAERQKRTDEQIDRLKPCQEKTDEQLERLKPRQENLAALTFKGAENISPELPQSGCHLGATRARTKASNCLAEIYLGCRDRINRSLDKSDEIGDYAQCAKYFSKISVVHLIEYKAKVI